MTYKALATIGLMSLSLIACSSNKSGEASCTTLEPSNVVAKEAKYALSAIPTAKGGTIPNGRYVCTGEDLYGVDTSDAQAPPALQEVLVISGTTWEYGRFDGDAGSEFSTYDVSASGDTLTMTQTCPNSYKFQYTYSVNADGSFILISPPGGGQSVQTFTPQK
jgi:hypothetical protein